MKPPKLDHRRAGHAVATLAFAACLQAGSGVAALGAQEGPVTLRLEARRGDTSAYRFEQRIDLEMPPEFGGRQEVGSLLVVGQRVERVDEDSIRYMAEVRDVTVEMDSAPMGSDLDFSRFEGQRFRMTLSRSGELLSVEPVEGAAPGAAQLQQSIRQVGFPTLPRGPVRVGDTWVDTTRVDASAMALPAAGEIVSVNRTTLRRLLSAGEATVAELAVETAFRFEPEVRPMPAMQVDVSGTRSDTVRFDVTRGRFLTSTGSQSFEMTMAIPGASGSLSIQGTATSRAELLNGS